MARRAVLGQRPHSFALSGGLDLVTPPVARKEGGLIGCINHEAVANGYARVSGYERLDGRPAPSAASYWVLNFQNGSSQPNVGDIVTGGTSGATGKVLTDVVSSGTYGGTDAVGVFVLTTVSGTFQDAESLEISATPIADAVGTAVERGADDDTDDMNWIQDAIETARALIQKPTGSGPIRGAWIVRGDRYCFRDNAGGTAGQLFKATSSGWQLQSLGAYIKFTTGSVGEMPENGTVTGGTSGATATVARVARRSGSYASNNAVGVIVLTGITGTFQSGETLSDGTNTAVADGTVVTAALPAGGRYECRNYNFQGGTAAVQRMYFANGVGFAGEWDGTIYVPIITGMPTDTPTHIAVNHDHLFLTFPGGSVQFSGIGEPYAWTPVLGAGEFKLGEEVTNLIQDWAKVLVVMGANKMGILSGTDSATFTFDPTNAEAGAVAWTAQVVTEPVYLDVGGVRSLKTTATYGDFKAGTLSRLVQPIFDAKKKAGVAAIASVRVRAKTQYRLFWDDGSGVSIYLEKKQPECTAFNMGEGVILSCAASCEDSDASEVVLAGSEDGWVYQLDSGNSYDGNSILAYARLPFGHQGSPGWLKRFHSGTLEVTAPESVTLGISAEFGYAGPDSAGSAEREFDVAGGGGLWDDMAWDSAYWSAPLVGSVIFDLDGEAENVSVAIVSDLTYEAPYILHGMTIRSSLRRMIR